MKINEKFKQLINILLLMNISILISCGNEGQETTTPGGSPQQITTPPKPELDQLYKDLESGYRLANNELTKHNKNTIKDLKEKLEKQNKTKQEKINILKEIKTRNKYIDNLKNFGNRVNDKKNRKGMIILEENEQKLKIVNDKNISQIIGKHDETDANQLQQVNEKLKKIQKYNTKINNLIDTKTQKQQLKKNEIPVNQVMELSDISEKFPNTIYQNSDEVLKDINELSKETNKSKQEILNLIDQNAELIKEIKQKNYNYYLYGFDNNKGEIHKKPANTDIFLLMFKNNLKKKNILTHTKYLCEGIKNLNKYKLYKQDYIIDSGTDPENNPEFPSTLQTISDKIDNESLKDYNNYIDFICKEKSLHNIIIINPTAKYTTYNSLFIEDDYTKLLNILKYTTRLIEDMYDVQKYTIKDISSEIKDKIGNEIIDTTTKEKYIASLLNLSGGSPNKLNISHRLAGKLTKDNYKSIQPIIQFLYEKGLDLTKNETTNNDKDIKETSFIEKAKKFGIQVTIKDKKVNMSIILDEE